MTPSLDALYDNALIWDNHACPPRENTLDFMSVLDRYHAAGVDVVGLNIGDSNVPLEELVRQAAHIRLYLDENPARYCLVRSTAEITGAKACGRTAVLLNVEGSYALNGQAGLIPVLFDIGVRWMAMVYNSATAVG
jgi:microsomal dipeptidase-like Zn-dependent dipeptidase